MLIIKRVCDNVKVRSRITHTAISMFFNILKCSTAKLVKYLQSPMAHYVKKALHT